MSKHKPKSSISRRPSSQPSRLKRWLFRLTALIGIPLVVLGLLEFGLRLGGFGYPSSFLLPSSNHGQKTWVQNDQFGWRFFGPRIARQPDAISIPLEKPPDTVRIFVFGESAAYGDPQPRFGLPRMLNVMLALRHPDKKFEVVNAAMTGINSHVILPLAHSCEEAHGDIWVICMGNNEVVGPFGAGSVFGSQTTPLPLIRAGLALKATRVGQLLDSLRRAAQKTAGSGEWEGMRMFVKNKLASSDPRLAVVYRNFDQNLKDIIAAGRNNGAKILLSTVAVNLKDCAPFASLHRPDLSESGLTNWQQLFDAGVKAQQDKDFQQAKGDYDEAERIDGSFAELHFRRGQCALVLNEAGTARKEFDEACDLDALRFRCDSRLNEIIRQEAASDVTLADSEKALAEASSDGIPGSELFYEHVHLTFQGNYVLARAIAEKVETALALSKSADWPTVARCEQRLGHTPRDTQLALSDMLGRLADVPFTFQANHDEQMRRLTDAAHGLPPANSAASLRLAQSSAKIALAAWPDDGALWEQLGEIKQAQGDIPGAAAAAQHSLDNLPSSAQCWLLDGIVLAGEEKYQDAAAAFKEVFTLDPQAVWARHNFALCLDKLGHRDEAIIELKRALALKPDYGTAWLALGQLDEEMGRTNDAEQCYASALTNRVNQADDLATLARFCFSRRWFGLAVTNYAAAIALSPLDPDLRTEAGRALSASGRHDLSAQQYQSAVELEPERAQLHLQLGVELGRLHKPALSEHEFRQALQIDPNLIDARADLGIALYEQEKPGDALKQFEDVLQRDPKNATALRYVQLVGNRPSSPPLR